MTLELTGERVRLRGWRADDAQKVWALVQEQETMFGPPGLINSLADADEWIGDQVRLQADPDRTRFRFAVELPSSSTFIGGCRLQVEDASNKMASIGLTLHKPHWGQGLGTEVVSLLLELAFDSLGLHRVEAMIDPGNERSQNLFKKLGFSREGLLRERIWEGRWLDTGVYSRLDHEWRAR
jgi:RimJ/RimL family protein N-acetyltransferase